MAYEGLMVSSLTALRGRRVGEALTPEIIDAVCRGLWRRGRSPAPAEKRRSVGRDSRFRDRSVVPTRGPRGACSPSGASARIGMVPTADGAAGREHHHAAGGLAITASHNPIEGNALKFIGPSGPLSRTAQKRRTCVEVVEGKDPRATWDKLGTVSKDKDAAGEHIERSLALRSRRWAGSGSADSSRTRLRAR